MNKVIYINNDAVFDIDAFDTLEIYHFVFDKGVNIKINLNGEYAKVIYHLSIISKKDNTCNVEVNHLAGNTDSNIICHGVNISSNNLEFNITGLIPKDMVKCICKEENQIINLKDGKSIIKPILLIRNYDSYSSHAAYIGELNKEKLFYLESRGIKRIDATRLLIEGLLLSSASKDEKIVKEFKKYLKEVL